MDSPRPTGSRREFLRRTATGVAAGAVAAAFGESGRAYAAEAPGPLFDIHTHLGMAWGSRPALGVADLLRWMDAHRIEAAAVLPLISPESWDHPLTTDYVLKETAPHRDRLVPFCSIDPRTTIIDSRAKKVDLLKRYRDAGARGFGEHKAGVAMDDPRNLETLAACAEIGLPVLFHLDNERNMDRPGLPGLASVLRQLPNGVFIGHAQGWWASISGDVTQEQLHGYPATKVAPGGAIDALMDQFPNLYGDLSAGSGANAIMRDLEFGREFLIRRADRLIFGTDYLAPEQKVPQFDLYRDLELPKDAAERIYRGNARRLLGLP